MHVTTNAQTIIITISKLVTIYAAISRKYQIKSKLLFLFVLGSLLRHRSRNQTGASFTNLHHPHLRRDARDVAALFR